MTKRRKSIATQCFRAISIIDPNHGGRRAPSAKAWQRYYDIELLESKIIAADRLRKERAERLHSLVIKFMADFNLQHGDIDMESLR